MPRPARCSFACFGLVVLVVWSGCGGNSGSTAPQGDPLGPATALAEKEALDFAASVEKAASNATAAPLQAMFDYDAIIRIAFSDINIPAKMRKGLIKEPGDLGERIHADVAEGGSYTFLRYSRRNDEDRLLFRLQHNGVNYHDLVIRRREDGQIKIVDLHVLLNGERFTQAVRRGLIPLVVQQDRSVLGRLPRRDQALVTHANDVEKILHPAPGGDPRQVLHIYSQLPAELQKEKRLLLARMEALKELGDDNAYVDAIKGFRQHYPGDACVDLRSIDFYLPKKRYEDARAAIARLNHAVGGDAYLSSLRANTYVMEENYATAREEIVKALKADPMLLHAHWVWLSIAVKEGKFDEVLRILTTMDKEFSMQWDDLTKNNDFKEFVKSPQYQEWLKHLEAEKEKP